MSKFKDNNNYIIAIFVIIVITTATLLYLLFSWNITTTVKPTSEKKQTVKLKIVDFSTLRGFEDDDMLNAIIPTKKSCDVFLRKPDAVNIGTSYIPMTAGDIRNACIELKNVSTKLQYKSWLKKYFNAYAVTDGNGKQEGKFTGYFEAQLYGSLSKTEEFKYPIYALPNDMVFLSASNWKDKKISENLVGMVKGSKFIPYYKRGQINTNVINALVIAWAKNPVDVFLLHVQGSGRIILPNGEVVLLAYAGNNGHKYSSLGRALINGSHITLQQANWASIKKWINDNTDKANDMLAVNARYIFFRKLPVGSDGPIGKMGVELTPRRSLAVDHTLFPMGMPIWLDVDGVGNIKRLQTLLQIQDTGSAIIGAVRGDFFWGYGDKALEYAGKMNSKGKYYILLPKTIKNTILRIQNSKK